ncbi:hypothetical protein BX616_006784 [Lobosporangium transversale]|nr:hypothetical protein BX616_006784 [Lobosporangium transversale]
MAFDIRDEDEQHHDEFDEYEDVKQSERPKFYRRRKFWICCIPTTIVVVVVAVILALYVIMPKIAQGLMNKSTINFSEIDITNPTATTMDIIMKGDMQNTGPFHAEISFPGEVTVSWNGTVLGTTQIPGSSEAAGGSGTLDLKSSFTVTNSSAFAEFSGFMLNAESFALGHTVKDLDLSKDITVNAFKGLSGITIQKFSLPGDDPSGKGILVEIDTLVTNPSAIQMYMGTLTLAISYKNTLMGYVSSSDLTMKRGQQTLSMKGVLIPQTTPEGLADTSEMMSRYIANVVTDTIATGYEVKPDGVNSVDWLSTAVKNLKLTVPLQSPQPLQLIKALNLGALGLVFTPPTAYEPITTSTGVLANYTLPDGFNFNIQFTQVANSFALSRNDVIIANLNSSYNPSTSNMAAGTLSFDLLATPLTVPEASRQVFQEFNRDLTVGSNLPFNVVGHASVFANTSIGTVNLINIPFNASTELSGLQSLANPAPTITSLQVISGTPTALTMAITVVIVNPSSISLNAGDITLDLVYKGARLGTVTMPNLAIVPGANAVEATSTIDPAASPEGMELLTLYTSGAGADVNIVGTPASTAVESLSLAFGALSIGSSMPGLQSKLLAGASLQVLETTLADGLAQTVVTVNNPFVPPMTILSIDSQITYNGISLGTVVSTFNSPPVVPGTGQGTITAGLALNTNPEDLVSLIRSQAIKNGLSVEAFDGLLSLHHGGNPPSSLFEGFNVADFVIKAMQGLSVDITMTTTVKVGEYQVTMPYTQTGVSTTTDQSILRLIPLVGTPIAQLLVDRSALAFEAITILSPAETGFQTDIVGAITETGPLDAQIQFPNPVTVSYNGKAIGSMAMPTVNAIANKGAALDLTGVSFTITELAAFTEFNVYALNNPKFEWTISTTGLVVNAMGVALPGVSMTKKVTLDGFNKLDGLQLSSYIINTIDDAGLHMVISASISNPSTIGMTIPTSIFNTQFHGKVLGPAVAEGLTLVPHGTSSFALNATIASGNGDMRPYLTGIFQNALNGVPTELEAQGAGAPGISWLDAAIKSLLLHTSLPPLADPPIESAAIDAMTMDFTCEACVWAPESVSTITAKTNLPFRDGAPIVQLSQNVQVLDKNGELVGTLSTAYSPANATGNSVTTITTQAPMVIAEGSHQIYEAFIADLTEATTYQLGLRGTANSVLDLGALGQIEVKGINLDVKTSLDGLQGLKIIEYVTNIGLNYFPEFEVVNLVNIKNPSKLTLKIGDLKMKVGIDYTPEGYAGESFITSLILSPGDNIVPAMVMLYNDSPQGKNVVIDSSMRDLDLALYAAPDTNKNPALNAGMQGVRTTTLIVKGLPPRFSSPAYNLDWAIKASPETVNSGFVDVTTTFNNPFFSTPYEFLSYKANVTKFPASAEGGFLKILVGDFLDMLAPSVPETDVQFKLLPSQSITVTYKMKLVWMLPEGISSLKESAKAGRIERCITTLMPELKIGNDPNPFSPDWSSATVYQDHPNPYVSVQLGPDADYMLKYYERLNGGNVEVPVPTATDSLPAPSPTGVPTEVSPIQPEPTTTTEAPVQPPIPSPEPIATTDEPAPPAPTPNEGAPI